MAGKRDLVAPHSGDAGPWPRGRVFFCGLHEFIHRSAFRSRWLNDWLAFIAGFIVFYPAYYFRCFHFAHHRHTQDLEHDPELRPPHPKTYGAYAWWVFGLPYWRRRFEGSLVHAVTGKVTQDFVRPSEVKACIAEARWTWAGYALVAALSFYFGSWAVLQYWVGPILMGQPFLRLYLMGEHTGCATSDDMIANSRTTITNPSSSCSPGTCPITPSTMCSRPSPSTRCRRCMRR